MSYYTRIFLRVSTLILFIAIGISCTNEETKTIEDTKVTVAFEDKNLVLNGDQKNVFDKQSPEASIVYVAPNGTITWELGAGLSTIAIRIDAGEQIFETLPKADTNGNYIGKIGNVNAGEEAKYSIIYTVIGDDTVYVLDPVVKVSSGQKP